MSLPWHQREPKLLSDLERELEKKYPDLRLSVSGEIVVLKGSFPILHEGVELDRFSIEIKVPPDFPKELPIVYEKNRRIPNDVDWHTFNGGNLCVIVPEEWLLNPQSHSLLAYVDGPLRNFFINHALAEAGLPRPMGERLHGSKGLLQAYGEIVGTDDAKAIIHYLDYCAAKQLKRDWKCPCGSGKRLEACHVREMLALRNKVPRWIAAKASERLRAQLLSERAARSSLQTAAEGRKEPREAPTTSGTVSAVNV